MGAELGARDGLNDDNEQNEVDNMGIEMRKRGKENK